MVGIDGVNSSNNINNTSNVSKTFQNSGKETNSASIFGDRNSNGIIDKSDFSDSKMAALAEEKGLIGKTWNSLKDSIDSLFNKNQTKPISENAQKARKSTIEFLKRENIPYKENPDGSIECEYDGHKEKYSYSGDTGIIELTYPNGNKIHETETYSGENAKIVSSVITNEEAGSMQVLKYDEAGIPTAQNYVKDKNGELVETDDFMFTAYDENGGNIYTGADISKLFNSEGFNIDSAKEFFENTYNVTASDINLLRDGGSIEIKLSDGTVIYQDNAFMTGDGSVTITKPDGAVEKYSRDGERSE